MHYLVNSVGRVRSFDTFENILESTENDYFNQYSEGMC